MDSKERRRICFLLFAVQEDIERFTHLADIQRLFEEGCPPWVTSIQWKEDWETEIFHPADYLIPVSLGSREFTEEEYNEWLEEYKRRGGAGNESLSWEERAIEFLLERYTHLFPTPYDPRPLTPDGVLLWEREDPADIEEMVALRERIRQDIVEGL